VGSTSGSEIPGGSGTAEGMVSERVFLGQGGAENMQCDGEK
jgi:hypothetical protein